MMNEIMLVERPPPSAKLSDDEERAADVRSRTQAPASILRLLRARELPARPDAGGSDVGRHDNRRRCLQYSRLRQGFGVARRSATREAGLRAEGLEVIGDHLFP